MRIRGDENALPINRNGKTLHHRNKSSPALSSLARGEGPREPLKRAALGNVSNTANSLRLAKDDNFISNAKEKSKPAEKLTTLTRPVQRASQILATKVPNKNNTIDAAGALVRTAALDALPVNPRKPPVRRNTVFQDSILPPLVESTASITDGNQPPAPEKLDSKSKSPTTSHDQHDCSIHSQEHQDGDSVLDGAYGLQKIEGVYIEDNGEIKIYNPTKPTACIPGKLSTEPQSTVLPLDSESAQDKCTAGLIESLSAEEAMAAYGHHDPASDPEESWYDDNENFVDDGSMPPRSHFYGTDNTTVGTTAILFPEFTANEKRDLAFAKKFVESTRTAQDYEDECFDPTMVAEYGDEIFDYMRKLEVKLMPNPHYMDNQAEIQWSMRSVLMDWIVQVHLRFNLLPETLFLCVNYIDRFLSSKIVSLGKLQLVGATAIFIAAKYEEINCPSVQEIVYMVDNTYTAEEILKAERFMLSLLQFELGWPGPMNFLRRISKADDYDLETRTLAKYFLEITIMDERFIGCPPSFLAAGAHCLARLMLRKGDWGATHVYYSNYTPSQLYPLVSLMLECCDIPQRHHPAIYEKYSDRRFKRASCFVESEILSGFQLPNKPRVPSANRLLHIHNRASAARRT
ncbi:G2/mitotic-specific cyclin 3 [Uncinocarpus reesii 1704]|uniref:G2/mitotic-specific cyclin 3 n=1 Tax=Uncinocarpus reesii (strain UAMH 1704) TaxID=336963 RepID=C4JUI9_UNCRE|nr:G2/mitotic-specific cyclin 3 [Uncinocarpus reesii 1704]EEP79950.1 G2/mitotic-specific cyclin 3 [Uncinocarpus reesii 1704]